MPPSKTESGFLETAQLRLARYLGYAVIQSCCPVADKRYDARFETLLDCFRDEKHVIRPEVSESGAEYRDLYLNVWRGRPSGKFIPLIVDAMFHEFFELHKRDNPLGLPQTFYEEELANYMDKYFPRMDQADSEDLYPGSAFVRLVQLCRGLKTEVEDLNRTQTCATPRPHEIEQSAPLKDRAEDIPALTDHFIRQYSLENGTDSRALSKPALDILLNYAWPGNIRELENVIQGAVILAGDSDILPEHLPSALKQNRRPLKARLKPGSGEKVNAAWLKPALIIALNPEGGKETQSGRLGQSVPLDQLVNFFEETRGRLFSPRAFADYISPPHWLNRRDKLSIQILRVLRKAEILDHNGRKALAARYFLRSRFLQSGTSE